MRSATVDANILISALVYGGNPSRLMEMALEGEVRLDVSDAIVAETLRVLREKFKLPEERIVRAVKYIEDATHRAVPTQTLNVVKSDPSDDRIIECAVAAGSECIITGDKHLLKLGQYEGIKIIKVSDFLREIQPGRER